MYSWEIWTEGADVVTEYGTVDGEKSISRKTAEAKNVGKSNETTPEMQAQSEAFSQWTKKKEKKYSETVSKAQETVFLPMLAHDYTKNYLAKGKSLEYPVDVQPKLEGVRCLAWLENGEVQLMSRGGKPWNVQHIKDELAQFLEEDLVLDGELYVHGKSQQFINAIVKKHREPDHEEYPGGSIQIGYYVYDCFNRNRPDETWITEGGSGRCQRLVNFFESEEIQSKQVKVVMVPTYLCTKEEDLFKYLDMFEKDGYEGVIIRLPSGTYTLGHRSRDLLKLKNFITAEFEIVGHEEAKGNDKGTVVWRCITAEDVDFTVRPTGTREQRAKWFQEAEEHYGEQLTVKFQGWTDELKPYFPVGVAIRLQEDM